MNPSLATPLDAHPALVAVGASILALIVAGLVMGIHALAHPPTAAEWSARLNRLRQRPWVARDALWLANSVLLAFTGSLLLGHWLSPRLAMLGAHHIILITLAQALALEVVILATVALIACGKALPWRTLFGFDRYTLRQTITTGLRFYLYSLPVVMGAALLNQVLLGLFDIDVAPQPLIELMLDPATPRWGLVAFTLLATCTAPLVEEALFRGLLLPLGLQGSSPFITVVLVSALFALIHFHPASALPLFAIGACLGVGMLHSGSVGVTIVMHAAFNTVNIVAIVAHAFVGTTQG